MQNHFLSCDWGTSNFRLRLVALTDLHVVDEVFSDQGVGELAKAWQAKEKKNDVERTGFYKAVLREHVLQLKSHQADVPQYVPVIISGMASSSIGLANLPYQALPVPTDGSGFKTQSFEPTADFPHEILLISGVQTADDVMRGEETQLIGCMTPEMQQYDGVQLIIHPGTHSKHIMVHAQQIAGFKTYMTGEFFKLLTTHGILRENIVANALTDDSISHFERGVADAAGSTLLHAAFCVRTNDLFRRLSKENNYHYLSGLLIGNELQDLKTAGDIKMYLCCGPGLFRQYRSALQVLGLQKAVEIFRPEWEESAVIRGQAKIWSSLRR